MSYAVGRRCDLDLAWLWPEAVALFAPQPGNPKKKKKKKKKPQKATKPTTQSPETGPHI